jgi:hypothetical protein
VIVYVFPQDRDCPGSAHITETLVYPVETSQECGLSASAGADQRGNQAVFDFQVYVFQGMEVSVPEVEIICHDTVLCFFTHTEAF